MYMFFLTSLSNLQLEISNTFKLYTPTSRTHHGRSGQTGTIHSQKYLHKKTDHYRHLLSRVIELLCTFNADKQQLFMRITLLQFTEPLSCDMNSLQKQLETTIIQPQLTQQHI